jgi:hypothetical protein
MRTNLWKATLILVVTSAVVFLVGIAPGRGAVSHEAIEPVNTDPIVGTWNCTLPAGRDFGLAADQVNVIKSFHADGTVTEMDSGAPPSEQTPTLGDWTKTSAHTYTAKLQQFVYDAKGKFMGTGRYTHPMLVLDDSLKTLTGTVDGAFLDAGTGKEEHIFSAPLGCKRY